MDADVRTQICEFFDIKSLLKEQEDVICAFQEGRDVFVCIPTGMGKSLTFQSIGFLRPEQTVLVFSPLVNIIIDEQTAFLNSKGLSACSINQANSADMLSGNYRFIYTNAEGVMDNPENLKLVRELAKNKCLAAIVVDEAHTVINWGEASDGNEAFRPAFSRIGEVRSHAPNVPILALTATASFTNRRRIKKNLCMVDCFEIVRCPDRRNLLMQIKKVNNREELVAVFEWLLSGIREMRTSYPRTIVFCKRKDDCGLIRSMLAFHLKDAVYNSSKRMIIEQLHSQTRKRIRTNIIKDMQDTNGNIRVLIATNSAGMGVNFASIDNVINYGPPQDMDSFLQQMGRAGRDGQSGHHVLLWKPNQLRNITDKGMLQYVKNQDGCRRKVLYYCYGAPQEQCVPSSRCCDQCTSSEYWHSAMQIQNKHEVECDNSEELDDHQKAILRLSLEHYRDELGWSDKTAVISPDVTHGFSNQTIENIVKQAHKIVSADDVMIFCNVWSYDHAERVVDCINDITGLSQLNSSDDEEFRNADD